MKISPKRLVALRLEKGLKQGELADQIKLSRTTLSNYEQGRREIRTATLLKIAEYFNVNVEYLIERTNYRQSVHSFSDVFIETERERIENGEFYELLKELSPENRIALYRLTSEMLFKQ